MRFHGFIAAVAMMAASIFSAAQAAPITYTLSGTMGGSSNSGLFTDKAFTWTITGDTSQKLTNGSGFSAVPALTSVLDVDGVGSSLTPLDPFFATAGGPFFATFAFTTFDDQGGIGITAPEFLTYDGVSSIGPIAVDLNGTSLFTTSTGNVLFIQTASNMMFQAVTVPDANVPEPLTLTLFGAGLAGICAMRRRRKAIA